MTETALVLDPRSPLLAFLERRIDGALLGRSLRAPLLDFLARPGKQLRARLLAHCWELAGGRGEPPVELPLAVELLHAGSLIVDDIEDGSCERRGFPALHLQAGMPIALNAGNWLYFAALELLGELPVDEQRRLRSLRAASKLLARCHEGQALDVGVRISQLEAREVPGVAEAIAERKTGGLSALCARLAAIAAGASPEVENALAGFATSVGVSLQMLDDCGGIAAEERREKGEEDLRNGRPTFAWAIAAKKVPSTTYRTLRQVAAFVEKDVTPAGELLERLRPLIGDDGRRDARERLDGALDTLGRQVRPSPALESCARLLRLLEESYG
jgi:geranylgeranyl pyrophosphate synthase